MNPQSFASDFLKQLEQFGKSNDAVEIDRGRKMLNLERETAALIQFLVLSTRRKCILEIGTSNGFSAIWIAAALRALNRTSPLITIEREAEKAAQARLNIDQVGLSDLVDIRLGDATEIVKALPGPFDCVFFDADRVSAPDQLRLLLPKLDQDVILLADNVLSHPEENANYLLAVEQLPDFTSMTVPVGKGLQIAYRAGQPVSSGNPERLAGEAAAH